MARDATIFFMRVASLHRPGTRDSFEIMFTILWKIGGKVDSQRESINI